MLKYVAEYLRISLDDDSPGESNSITSQRQIIEGYRLSAPDLMGMPVKTFVDDGYSGVSFNRPAVIQLLEAVQKGEVSCIIVKDFSRFGRNYLEVSRFMEQWFPYFGVRFIAVNDHYDSERHKGTTAEIDVPIRNMINALYSKDIAKKVKSAKRTQASQGKHIHAFAPYGYQKDAMDKHRLVIDEPAAKVVRRIFKLRCDGHGPAQIARILNAEGVLTPSAYKKQNGSSLAVNGISSTVWSNGMVTKILRDEQYTGTLISGKVETGALGTGKRIYRPQEEWIRIPDAYPGIITQEIWNTAAAKKGNAGNRHGKPDKERMLFKKVRCGYCGHVLRYIRYKAPGKGGRYYCGTPRYTADYGCKRDRYLERTLVDTVKSVLQLQVIVMGGAEALCRGDLNAAPQHEKTRQASLILLDREIMRLQSLRKLHYEQYKNGTINELMYRREKETVEAAIHKKQAERKAWVDRCLKDADEIAAKGRLFDLNVDFQDTTGILTQTVNTLIKTIRVYDEKRMEITFDCKDEWMSGNAVNRLGFGLR